MDKNIETLKSMRDELCKQVDALAYAIRTLENSKTKKSKNKVTNNLIIEETEKNKTNIQPTIFGDPPQPTTVNGYYEGGPGGICT